MFDGHEFFRSRSRCCAQCSHSTFELPEGKVTEYYHRGVVCHLEGYEISVPLDLEMTLPGESEVGTAKRLLERVLHYYPRFFDVIVLDALYFEAPFVNFCLARGKDVVVVAKGDERDLLNPNPCAGESRRCGRISSNRAVYQSRRRRSGAVLPGPTRHPAGAAQPTEWVHVENQKYNGERYG